MKIAIWVVQCLLAAFAMAAGINHGLRPLADAVQTSPWIAALSPVLVRFIGWSELAAGIGLVLPAATRVAPFLTPWAAVGLATVMGLAIPFHIQRGEVNVIVHIVVVLLCLFVAWGRFARAPIPPRQTR